MGQRGTIRSLCSQNLCKLTLTIDRTFNSTQSRLLHFPFELREEMWKLALSNRHLVPLGIGYHWLIYRSPRSSSKSAQNSRHNVVTALKLPNRLVVDSLSRFQAEKHTLTPCAYFSYAAKFTMRLGKSSLRRRHSELDIFPLHPPMSCSFLALSITGETLTRSSP